MEPPKSNQDLYNRLDEVCERLTAAGMKQEGKRIHTLVHEVAWTTSTELFYELECVIGGILHNPPSATLPVDLRGELETYFKLLAEALDRRL